MSKKTLVLKKNHVHYWIVAGNDASHSGNGEIVDAYCKSCGATTSLLNYLDWSVIEKKKKKPVKEEVEDVDILSTEE